MATIMRLIRGLQLIEAPMPIDGVVAKVVDHVRCVSTRTRQSLISVRRETRAISSGSKARDVKSIKLQKWLQSSVNRIKQEKTITITRVLQRCRYLKSLFLMKSVQVSLVPLAPN